MIEQAAGLLAGIHGMDVNQTLIRQHSYGRNHNRRPVDSTPSPVSHPDAVPT